MLTGDARIDTVFLLFGLVGVLFLAVTNVVSLTPPLDRPALVPLRGVKPGRGRYGR